MYSPNDQNDPAMDAPEPRIGDFIFAQAAPTIPLEVMAITPFSYEVKTEEGETSSIDVDEAIDQFIRHDEQETKELGIEEVLALVSTFHEVQARADRAVHTEASGWVKDQSKADALFAVLTEMGIHLFNHETQDAFSMEEIAYTYLIARKQREAVEKLKKEGSEMPPTRIGSLMVVAYPALTISAFVAKFVTVSYVESGYPRTIATCQAIVAYQRDGGTIIIE